MIEKKMVGKVDSSMTKIDLLQASERTDVNQMINDISNCKSYDLFFMTRFTFLSTAIFFLLFQRRNDVERKEREFMSSYSHIE